MTKKELIEAMKDFPHDMEIMLRVEGGYEPLCNVSKFAVEVDNDDCTEFEVVNYILLKDMPCYEESGYEPIP